MFQRLYLPVRWKGPSSCCLSPWNCFIWGKKYCLMSIIIFIINTTSFISGVYCSIWSKMKWYFIFQAPYKLGIQSRTPLAFRLHHPCRLWKRYYVVMHVFCYNPSNHEKSIHFLCCLDFLSCYWGQTNVTRYAKRGHLNRFCCFDFSNHCETFIVLNFLIPSINAWFVIVTIY